LLYLEEDWEDKDEEEEEEVVAEEEEEEEDVFVEGTSRLEGKDQSQSSPFGFTEK